MAFFLHHIKPNSPPVDLAAISAANPHLQQPQGDGTEHYVTLFDANFLPQGLCLYYSLVRHGGDFVLWVLCIDRECLETLQRLNLPRLRLLDLEQFETPELLSVKPTRSRTEYCWTLTPFTVRFVFEADSTVQRATYLDADMFFFKSPRSIFEELEATGKSVLITDHAYAPEYDESATSGQYCVQFMTFTRIAAEPVRKWWEVRCIEWCKARSEHGKFGDQKYIESFESLFPSLVHVLQRLDILLAPWNACRFPYSRCIAYHFHSLRLTGPASPIVLATGRRIPRPTVQNVYHPYVLILISVLGFHGLTAPQQVSYYRSTWIHCAVCCLMILRRNSRIGMFERYVVALP